MKKAISVILIICLLLPGIALADVQGQVSAPAHVADRFQSNTGRTVIDVDAQVNVPDAKSMFLISVRSTVFDDSMVPRLADLIWPGLGRQKLKIVDRNDTASIEGRRQANKYFLHSAGVIQMGTQQNDMARCSAAAFHTMRVIVRNRLSTIPRPFRTRKSRRILLGIPCPWRRPRPSGII